MADIALKRAGFDQLGDQITFAADIQIEATKVADVNCFWLRQERVARQNQMLIYIHGGIFTLGSFKSHGPWVSHLAAAVSMDTVFIEYQRAPEAPYPGAPNEIVRAVGRLLENNPDLSIVLAGDSAGGGLVVSVLPELAKAWPDQVGACILLSPFVDLTCSMPSYDQRAQLDPKLSRAALYDNAMLYVADTPLEQVNPVVRLSNPFPPTLIMVGSHEVLLDDSRLTHEKISHRQDACSLNVFDGQSHVWVMDDITSEASVAALNDIVSFLDEHIPTKG